MQQQIDEIIKNLTTRIEAGTIDGQTLQQAFETFGALELITELDRMHQMTGFVRICDLLLEYMTGQEGEEVRAQRDAVAERIHRWYSSYDTPYNRSRSIIQEVAGGLTAGGDVGEIVPAALAELESLSFEAIDMASKAAAIQAVEALGAAHEWLAGYAAHPQKLDPTWVIVWVLALTTQNEGLKCDSLIMKAQEVRSARFSFDGTVRGHASVLRVLFGVGLQLDPTALPGLEPVRVIWMEALAEAREAEPTFAERCNVILAEFERALNEAGFSEYLWYQTNANLKELEAQSAEDSQTLLHALVRLCDLAIPHAPLELAQGLEIVRGSTYQSILDLNAPQEPPIDAKELQVEGEKVLQRLRDDLASGVLPTPAFMRAQTSMQALTMRIGSDDEEAAKAFLPLMPEMVAILAGYAEPDKAALAEDMVLTIRQTVSQVEEVLDDEPGRAEVAGQAMVREMKRMAQNPTADPWESADAQPHQRQFAALFRPMAQRVTSLIGLPDSGPRETAEAKRISERGNIAVQRLRGATTEEQWIENQRGSLRRVAVELRQFERRHHLMLIEPSLPTYSAMIDANAVFFGGTAAVESIVDEACARIGMAAPEAQGADDPTHTRWDMLRRSAVAAFDFTTYDRATSDPLSALPRSREKLTAIAKAAAPTARVSYECGWALVLGTPMVIIARAGQDIPFDIDVEPVRLADDDDAMRVILGLQNALYGVPRAVRTDDLDATLQRLRERLAGDAKAQSVLNSLADSRDAVEIQLAAEVLIERQGSREMMLTIPVFPPAYPASDGARRLFHVTAFRKWSKPCEEVVRQTCVRAGIEYTIGYEQLNPDILGTIWRDIATSSLVVADLTCLNPNAVLELGIAHALGRPTLVLSRTPDLPKYLPALAKVRVHSYDTSAAGKQNLAGVLDRFFRDAPSMT